MHFRMLLEGIWGEGRATVYKPGHSALRFNVEPEVSGSDEERLKHNIQCSQRHICLCHPLLGGLMKKVQAWETQK